MLGHFGSACLLTQMLHPESMRVFWLYLSTVERPTEIPRLLMLVYPLSAPSSKWRRKQDFFSQMRLLNVAERSKLDGDMTQASSPLQSRLLIAVNGVVFVTIYSWVSRDLCSGVNKTWSGATLHFCTLPGRLLKKEQITVFINISYFLTVDYLTVS